MSAALLFFLLVGPFFAVLAAWVYTVWPEDFVPFEDEDRRHG